MGAHFRIRTIRTPKVSVNLYKTWIKLLFTNKEPLISKDLSNFLFFWNSHSSQLMNAQNAQNENSYEYKKYKNSFLTMRNLRDEKKYIFSHFIFSQNASQKDTPFVFTNVKSSTFFASEELGIIGNKIFRWKSFWHQWTSL